MMRSLAEQTITELGGPRSLLTRQKRDHIELDRLLHAVNGATSCGRQEQLNRLCRLVFPHAFAEESVLWPVIRKLLPDGEQLTLAVEREHQEINELFAELEKTGPNEARHRELWGRIVRLLREDVRDEEDVLLPALQAALSRSQLVVLGVAWEAVRRTAPTRPHAVVARRPPGNVLAAFPLTITDRLRDRLDRLARSEKGSVGGAARSVSSALAHMAGVIEHVPPLTRGEDPSTRHHRNP